MSTPVKQTTRAVLAANLSRMTGYYFQIASATILEGIDNDLMAALRIASPNTEASRYRPGSIDSDR